MLPPDDSVGMSSRSSDLSDGCPETTDEQELIPTVAHPCRNGYETSYQNLEVRLKCRVSPASVSSRKGVLLEERNSNRR